MLFSGRLYNNIAASLKEEYAFYTIQVHVVGLMIIIFYVSSFCLFYYTTTAVTTAKSRPYFLNIITTEIENTKCPCWIYG